MNSIQYPQSVVGIVGRGAALTVRSPQDIRIEVVESPDGVRPREQSVRGSGEVTVELATRKKIADGRIVLNVEAAETGQTQRVTLPMRVWGPRMHFICLVQSSNTHIGWDPRPMAQYYRRDDSELVLYDDDRSGNHAWVHARKLERIFHRWDTPITWLIDDMVAGEQADQIIEWQDRYGDAAAFLPRSFFYYNKRNYNLTHTAQQLVEIISPQIAGLEQAFANAGRSLYCRVMGADQWVGSPGTAFVEAASHLGFDGLWGIGYDHDTCDTSMYHKGTPWDVYKPRPGNFRVPGGEGDLWLFQWTTRDILNTSYFTARVGSTTFSTDADDIKYNGIPRFQNDYYARLLEQYRRNLSHHDVSVFLVHQEDHDSHIHESNRVLSDFVDQVHDTETFATLDEVTAWLNRRFLPEEHPYQLIEMSDPLTCHAKMKAASLAGDIPGRFAENAAWAKGDKPNPPHAAYYGEDMLWIIEEGASTPKIYYDYRKSDRYEFVEDGEYPTEDVPAVSGVSLKKELSGDSMRVVLTFDASGTADSLPVAVWHESLPGLREGRLSATDQDGREVTVWRTQTAFIVLPSGVTEGLNEIELALPITE